MSYRTQKTPTDMDYLTLKACNLIFATCNCESKEEVVKELYWFYEDVKQTADEVIYNLNDPVHREKTIELLQKFYEEDREASEKRYERIKIMNSYDKYDIEDYLLVAVYAEKKLTWEDIKYTHKHCFLPAEKRKQPFPLEEMKQELVKKGYTLAEESKEEKEMTL